MMRTVVQAIVTGVLILASAQAAMSQEDLVRFHLRDVTPPATVPGGTASLLLHPDAPAAATPTTIKLTIPHDDTTVFPLFASQPFSASAILTEEARLLVHLSANIEMDACADIVGTLYRMSSSGSLTMLGNGALSDQTVPRSTSGGTQGFAPFVLNVTLGTARNIDTGEGLAFALAVTNHCSNRGVTLVYDGTTAPSHAEVGYESCQASTQTTTVALQLNSPNNTALSGVSVIASYPLAVSLPGVEAQATVAARTAWSGGGVHIARDLNDAVVLTAVSSTALDNDLVDLTFDVCIGADPPGSGQYSCIVADASDDGGRPIVGATCTITVLP